jgi:5-methylcytosine-specific restriction endonuclease McrA
MSRRGQPWFRLWAEFRSDPKVQMLSFDDQRHYVCILCMKCEGILDGGELSGEFRNRLICKGLGLDPPTAAEVKRRLLEVGLIADDWQPAKWEERQFSGDISTARVARYRERRTARGLPAVLDENRAGALLLARDGSKRCVYCLSTESPCIDHMVPVGIGGNDDLDNLAFACKRCNSGKGGRTPAQAGYQIRCPTAAAAHAAFLSRNLSRTDTVTVTAPERETDPEADTEPEGEGARATQLPTDFGLTEARRLVALQAGIAANQVKRVFDKFTAHYRAAPCDRPRRWDEVWKLWCSRELEFVGARGRRDQARNGTTHEQASAGLKSISERMRAGGDG